MWLGEPALLEGRVLLTRAALPRMPLRLPQSRTRRDTSTYTLFLLDGTLRVGLALRLQADDP